MKRLTITAATVLSLSAPALASEQLARSLGVEPGAYTVSELARLKAASTESGNEARVNLDRTTDGTFAARAQLAASLGVDASAYSLAELVQLKEAAPASTNEGTVFTGDSGTPGVSMGERQLATALGVDAADYSLSELAEMYMERFGGEDGNPGA